MKKIVCVVGTRPEAIKMAPVINALKLQPWADVRVLAAAQHRQMLDQVLTLFDIVPDGDMNVMQTKQNLTDLTARLLLGSGKFFDEEKPDAVLVQGDTTTVMAVALAAFYRQIPIGHVEAGLRTGDLSNPFPEEANRVIAGRLARWHFAPTQSARANLLGEGVSDADIFVTGNTVIDALLATANREIDADLQLPVNGRLILITCHRRENFGAPIRRICMAIRQLAEHNTKDHFLYPVHPNPNPNVMEAAESIFAGLPNVQLCAPLDYAGFVAVMRRSYLIISDSGGIQEEAPALGKPVLVVREKTERSEAVEENVVRLVGTTTQRIVAETQSLLDDPVAYGAMARGISPYGDGQASQRIADILTRDLASLS